MAGWTQSSNFPTLNAQQGSNAGYHDAFVAKLLPRPGPPLITGISPDTGISSTDALTKATTLHVLGTGLPSATAEVYRGGVGFLGTTTVGSGATWSFDYTGTVLPQGVTDFSATESAGGLTSTYSPDFLATVDLTPPTVTLSAVLFPETLATLAA